MQLRLHQYDLRLKHPFRISRGEVTVQPTLIVELVEGAHHGYGEATTNPYYGVTIENMAAALESVRLYLEPVTLSDPGTLWSDLASRLAAHRSQEPGVRSQYKTRDVQSSILAPHCLFALCALDEAAHDLWGKRSGAPVWKLWEKAEGGRGKGETSAFSLPPSDLPLSSFTVGIDTIDRMVTKLAEVPDWPVFKIKLGTSDDLAIVRELRRHTDVLFRVDANGGWTVDEALRNAAELATLGVEFIEQPLPADDWDGHRRVFHESPLPIIADESCMVEADVDRCRDCFHGINIKLVKCGGLTPARRTIDRARALGLKVMVGCMTESTVGISAIAQLLPWLDYVDMDGAALLAQDIASGVQLDHGRCVWPAENGTGVRLIDENA